MPKSHAKQTKANSQRANKSVGVWHRLGVKKPTEKRFRYPLVSHKKHTTKK